MKVSNQKNLHNHPYYFGAFLNMARHNAFMIIRHLSAKYDTDAKEELIEDQLNKAKIFTYLSKKFNKPDITRAFIRDLKKYLPCLNYPLFLNLAAQDEEKKLPPDAFETDPQALADTIKGMLILLNDLRNHFSHYISTVDYNRVDFEPIEQIYRAATYRLTDRGKHTKRFDVFEQEHVGHLRHPSSVYLPKSLSEIPEDEHTITFIACLFLERKYAFPFLSRLKGFQRASHRGGMEWKATLEGYTMFCCRLPQPKLDSSDILLDMVNELGRCPSALYTVLSEEDRQRFHIAREDIDELEDDIEETELEDEIIFKRHSDRFPYFALRYFDDTEAFPRLRFDVHLGRWRTTPVYEKVMYGEKRERLLTQPIRTFARFNRLLPLAEAVTQDITGRKEVQAKLAPYFRDEWLQKTADGNLLLDDRIEQFSPQYNFGDQVIGLKMINPHRNKNIKNTFPKLPEPKNEKADAIISTYELRNLFLYHYLATTPLERERDEPIIKVDTETFIQNYIDKIKRFFKDVKSGKLQPLSSPPDYRKNQPLPFVKGDKEATQIKRAAYRQKQERISERKEELNKLLQDQYGLQLNYIPRRLKEYLLAYTVPPYRIRATQKFREQQTIVKDLLKDAEKGRSPRVGEQATWLAEDIIFLTPPVIHYANGEAHPQKLNNDQFRILQSSLAYFSANKNKLDQFLRKETTILSKNKEEQHPFLFKLDLKQYRGIFDFYTAYLVAKEKWLSQTIKKIRNFRDAEVEKRYGYFLPSSVKHKVATELDYTNLPIYLPRGLFNAPIAAGLAEYEQFAIKPTDNGVHAIAQIVKEDTQAFYHLSHFYYSIFTDDKEKDERQLIEGKEYAPQLLNELEKLKKEKQTVKQNKKQELKNAIKDVSRAKSRLLDREQYIRSIQADDRVLWLMIQERQRKVSEHLEIQFDDLKLENIESILKEPVRVKLRIPETDMVITDQLPLRRYGDLRRIAKDRRLANLSVYYEKAGISQISHDLIKEELERFDRRRETFFETIYHFEKMVYTKFQKDFNPPEEGKGYYPHGIYVGIAAGHSFDAAFNSFFKKEVVQLRNKFYHNEFPLFDWLLLEVAKKEKPLYSDWVFDVAEDYYTQMRDRIE